MDKAVSALLGAALLLLAGPAARAQDEGKYTVITGTGEALYRIAIPPVLDGGGAAEAARTVQAVMQNDMTLIGLFKVLSPAGFLANLAREGTGIELQRGRPGGGQGQGPHAGRPACGRLLPL